MSITIRHSGIVVENMKKSLIFWNKILKLKILRKSLEYSSSIFLATLGVDPEVIFKIFVTV